MSQFNKPNRQNANEQSTIDGSDDIQVITCRDIKAYDISHIEAFFGG